ncbi:MAG: tRNA pseudouridine(38-40) synthase TruA [Acidimicrobiales bacterium]
MTLFDPSGYARAAPTGPLVRVRLTVAYDGTDFHGFADQPGLVTVAGRLSAGLDRVLGHQVELTGAGRTDRGVHAWGQVISFDANAAALERVGAAGVIRRLNKLCGPEIVARDLQVADEGFDARFSARSRRYRYRLLNTANPDPLWRRYAWWIPEPLSVRAMQAGADALLGEHDFSSFCRRPKTRDGVEVSLVRRVVDATWSLPDSAGPQAPPGLLCFEIESSAFCHQMVRSIVGTLVAMGSGRRTPGEMLSIIRAADRAAAPQIAPPHGLCLWRVSYHERPGRQQHPGRPEDHVC